MEARLHNIRVFQGNTSSALKIGLKGETDHTAYINNCVAKLAKSRKENEGYIIHTFPLSLTPDKSKIIIDLSIPETIDFTHKPEDLHGLRKFSEINPVSLPGKHYYWDFKFEGSQVLWGAFFVLQNVS